MKSRVAIVSLVLIVVAGIGVDGLFAQPAPIKRNFEAEIQAALESAKTAAGFEFLGTLVRTCLLPQSGGEDTRDNVPNYITNPASAPARQRVMSGMPSLPGSLTTSTSSAASFTLPGL